MYEEWAQCYRKRFPQAAPAAFVCNSVLAEVRSGISRLPIRITLYPNTWARVPAINPRFASEDAAFLHDWYMVGADLYKAMQESKIGLICAGTPKTEPNPATGR
jgi:hypothetical protein